MAAQLDPAIFWCVFVLVSQTQHYYVLLGSRTQWYWLLVLRLAWQPDPTALGPIVKLDQIGFDRGDNTPTYNSWEKTQQRNAPQDSMVFITQIITIFNINTTNYSKNNNIYNMNNTIFIFILLIIVKNIY